jgi:pentatricopeptide repeat protein
MIPSRAIYQIMSEIVYRDAEKARYYLDLANEDGIIVRDQNETAFYEDLRNIVFTEKPSRKSVDIILTLMMKYLEAGFEVDRMAACLMISFIGKYDPFLATSVFNKTTKTHPPNLNMYTVLIQSYARRKLMDRAVFYFRNMKEAGIKPNSLLYLRMISGFSVSHDFQAVFQLLQEMVDRNILVTSDICTNIITSAENMHPDVVFEMIEFMKNHGIYQTRMVNTLFLKMVLKHKIVEKIEVATEILERSHRPSVQIVDSLIRLYAKEGQVAKALEFYEMARKKGIVLPRELVSRLTHGLIVKRGSDLAPVATSTVVSLGKRSVQQEDAERTYLRKFCEKSPKPNVYNMIRVFKTFQPRVELYAEILSQIYKHDDWHRDDYDKQNVQDRARERKMDSIFDNMISLGITPNQHVLTLMVKASMDFERGMYYFELYKKYNVQFDGNYMGLGVGIGIANFPHEAWLMYKRSRELNLLVPRRTFIEICYFLKAKGMQKELLAEIAYRIRIDPKIIELSEFTRDIVRKHFQEEWLEFRRRLAWNKQENKLEAPLELLQGVHDAEKVVDLDHLDKPR